MKSLGDYNDDISLLKETGISVIAVGEKNMVVNIKAHMMDMKAAHLYLGLGGAYCDLCNYSKEQCTGNTARKLLHEKRHIVIDMLPDEFKDVMRFYGQNLSVILRAFSSGHN